MKLSNFLKTMPATAEKRNELDYRINLLDNIMKSAPEKGRMGTLGVDTLINSWIRQQLAYREQLYEDLLTISRTVAEVSSPIMHIRNEVFRNGIVWEPKFNKKCKECGKEYENIVEECERCGSKELRGPDEEQLEHFKMMMDDCNIMDQSLTDVLGEFSEGMNAVDDGFLWVNKEYLVEPDGKVRSKPVEIRNLRASGMDFDLDANGVPKNSHWICVLHRNKIPEEKEGYCEEVKEDGTICGCKLVPAMYIFKHRGRKIYLTDSEVCHSSKFHPSVTYGFPPLLTVFEKVMTLIGMDRTLFRYFWERKMPASMLLVATDNVESIRAARSEIVQQLRQDPDYIPMVGYTPKQGSRGRVDFIKLFHTLQEMEYLPVRQEIRERIAGMYGLPPLWQAQMEGSGGLASQSQQLVQFSRVVESEQKIFNDKVFPFLFDAFGITDWNLTLRQPEEKSEAIRIQFAQQRTSVAAMLKNMGFKVELRQGIESVDDIDFKISGEMTEQDNPFGGFAGQNGNEGENPTGQFGSTAPEKGQFGLSIGWTEQILKKGYTLDGVADISIDKNFGTTALIFKSQEKPYIATFLPNGNLVDVWPFSPLDTKKSEEPKKRGRPPKKVVIEPEDDEDEDGDE